jgi:hypothetical protein
VGYEYFVRRVSFFFAILILGSALDAQAQSKPAGNRAAAEALFNQGRDLVNAGRYAEACPKFEASQQLDPGLGTMLNLADCYEKTGRTASAWAEYREAIPLARAAGSKTRLDLATERAEALEARLSTLTIRAMAGDASTADLEVRRDGVALQPAELGAAIPVDPGEYVIEARAPGKRPWTTKVSVAAEAAKVEVEIPPLEPAPAGAAAAGPEPIKADPGPALNEPAPSGSAQRTAGIVSGAAGLVGLGVGAFFGVQASSNWSSAKDKCADYPYECPQEAQDLRSDARSRATVSTVAFIAGGALLATGAVLYFTAPKQRESVALRVTPGAAFLEGRFQ